MDPNIPDGFGWIAGLGVIFAVVWFVVTASMILLALWIQYTIMWRAVRRGLREFHYGGKVAPQAGGYSPPPAQ
jgi:hypothetical protein